MVRFALALALAVFVLGPAPADAQRDAHVDAARRALQLVQARFEAGQEPVEEVYTWSIRLVRAQVAYQRARRRIVLREHIERMEALAEAVQEQVEGGVRPAVDTARCAYYLVEARHWLRAGGGP
ncbi:MAG TPA: hypothetical protein RMH85_25745 [Polyangiaceae bacterium LLY-WYZ-15_(1-7)]|mgnify:CR=1 FL=1|nr:hypothetical protein [Myxococcales bacterium]MAT29460.1 hypothetical protein [Sandaracinus sp.]HJK91784.1 hypothetical protein [Polyangiaceae bacterium LLY-WYZ-15_(1-7)]HJL02102.1 hypothetical protein [Polyangiaceae bacterium LLY-WYZ-15_(1-7)]HJL11906.1 hypothetical protein [Polyangiaceae bacterium LLY-WYZ-15_(1-7)]